MLFAQKVVTVGKVSDFVKKVEVPKAKDVAKVIPFIGVPLLVPSLMDSGAVPTFAASAVPAASMKHEVSQRIIEAFQPLIDLVSGLAYPIAFISIATAGVKWILNDREGAIRMLQGAAGGFCLVQMSPLIMKLLVSVTAGF